MAQRVELPDGNIAEFPDGMQPQEIEAVLQKQYPPQQQQAQAQNPNPIVDSIRNAPGAVARGVAGLAGLPGDVNELLDTGANWAMSKMTGKPVDISTRSMPTAGEINKTISEPFGGYYEPQTTLGKYTGTALEFLPAALAPGSAGTRAMRVLSPAIASETGGQLTEGTAAEPYARAAGALIGGIGQGLGEARIAARANPTPSLDELGKMKTATYKAAEQQGVVIAPQSVQKFAVDISDDLLKNNVVSDKLHPQTLAALESIKGEAAKNVPLSLERADILRQEVTGAFENASSRDARLLRKVKDGLDDFLDNLSPTDTLSGDPAVAVPILKEARALAQREFKATEIQKLIDLAENSASTNYSASGVEQALRVQFKNFNAKLIKDPSLAKSFSTAEREAIRKVAEGGPVGNVLRYFGKFSPTGPVSSASAAAIGGGAGATIGSLVGGPFGAPIGALMGAGLTGGGGGLARAGATAATTRNAQMAAELMRRGAPLPQTQGNASLIADLLLSQQGVK